jgi:hypothetical protein
MAQDKSRTLNMEEKRKVEKILLADIDGAVASLASKSWAEHKRITEKLEANPPAAVRALFKLHEKARKEQKETNDKIEALGWDIRHPYNEEARVVVATSGTKPQELADHITDSEAKKDALVALKRTYTLKLFAGDGEASELIQALAKELAKIIN